VEPVGIISNKNSKHHTILTSLAIRAAEAPVAALATKAAETPVAL
jgi:hypothetical protein